MNLIDQLAEILGFHSSYTGAFGDQVFAKDQAKRALLEAMGYKLDDELLIKSIEQLKNRQWVNILPVVHIAKLEEQQHTIKISLPKSEVELLHWNVVLEINDKSANKIDSKIKGSVNVSDMQIIAETIIGETHYCQYDLVLPTLEQGYHQLNVIYGDIKASCPLIYAPRTCYSPQEASMNKVWGYTAQLYSLTSKTNWGIGDFTDLKTLVDKSSDQQAATIGLNPLHPLYQKNPAHRSPYSPSSRCFLNPLYIDVTKAPNFDH